MLHCQMRRQTSFYYHFKEFGLLSWIYREETRENIIDFLDYERGKNIFDLLFDYFYENQNLLPKCF